MHGLSNKGKFSLLPNSCATFWLGVAPIGHRIKIEKLKIHWSICDVRGPLGANFAIFLPTDFVKTRPNCFRKNPSRPGTTNPGDVNFCINSFPPCGGFVPRNWHAVTCTRAGL